MSSQTGKTTGLALLCAAAAALAIGGCAENAENAGSVGNAGKQSYPAVMIETSQGTIKAELWPDKAPATVRNFLRYVDEKHYDGTIFHRVIPTFMIQGGGFTPDMNQKPCHEPIVNEATNGLKNLRGTLAMARTDVVNSATAQFYINTVDNRSLDHAGAANFGYAVFGQVVEGMDVVDKIRQAPTATTKDGMDDVPVTPVVIKSIRRAGK